MNKAKSTSGLEDSDRTLYLVQIDRDGEWKNALWIMFTKTLQEFLDPKIPHHSASVQFDSCEIALKAAETMHKAHSDQHFRVIERRVIIEETFIKEIK